MPASGFLEGTISTREDDMYVFSSRMPDGEIIMVQQLFGSWSLVRVVLEDVKQEEPEWGCVGNSALLSMGEGEILGDGARTGILWMRANDLGHQTPLVVVAVAIRKKLVHKHLDEDDSQYPDVNGKVVGGGMVKMLRGIVNGGASRNPAYLFDWSWGNHRGPKVDDFDNPSYGDHEVEDGEIPER